MSSGSISNLGATWSSCDATPARGCAVGVGPLPADAEEDEEEKRLATILFADALGNAVRMVPRVQLRRTRPPTLLANITAQSVTTSQLVVSILQHRNSSRT